MSVFQLKGDVLSYNFTGQTGLGEKPSTSFSTYLGFVTATSGQTSGDTNTLIISYTNGKNGDVTNIIDLLDGIASAVKVPDKTGTTETIDRYTPSSRCAVTTPNATVVFDVFYNKGVDYLALDFASYEIEIISSEGSISDDEAVYFTYNYYGSGGDLSPITGGYYQITTGATAGFGDITLTGTTSFSALTDLVLYNTDLYQNDLTSLLRFKPQTLNYGFISLKKEGSQKSNTYLIEGSVISSDKVKFDISAVTLTNESITHGDGLFVSLTFNGSSGSSGSSGTSGSSGSSGTSGSSGSSGTSGSSGSSGTSGSSGSSGTSGSSGSSGTSGSSGSSGTSGKSGTANITNLGDNRVLTSTGVQGEANAEENMTFDGFNFDLTGSSVFNGSVDVNGSLFSSDLSIVPTIENETNITNGAISWDLNELIFQGATYWRMGEIYNYDSIQSQVYGGIYCLSGNSASGFTWTASDASALGTSTGLLGVGILTGDTGGGLLLRGFINVNSSFFSGTDIPGAPLYMSITAGRYSFDPPTNTGEIVRVVGYFIKSFQDQNSNILYLIYFNPDNNWIEL